MFTTIPGCSLSGTGARRAWWGCGSRPTVACWLEGKATYKAFLGAGADLTRNLHGVVEVAGLDGDEAGNLLGRIAANKGATDRQSASTARIDGCSLERETRSFTHSRRDGDAALSRSAMARLSPTSRFSSMRVSAMSMT